MLFDIPPYYVAISSIITAFILLWGKEEPVKINVLAISLFMQFVVYILFSFTELPQEVRQFIARLNAITTNAVISGIILINRKSGWKMKQ